MASNLVSKQDKEIFWNRLKYVCDYFRRRGIKDEVIAALMGNMAQESSGIWNKENRVKQKDGSVKIYRGLVQNEQQTYDWVLHNYGGYSKENQLEFIADGILGNLPEIETERGYLLNDRFTTFNKAAKSSSSPAYLAKMWENIYEISGSEIQKRQELAEYFYLQIIKEPPLSEVEYTPEGDINFYLSIQDDEEAPLKSRSALSLLHDKLLEKLKKLAQSSLYIGLLRTKNKHGGKLIKRGQYGMQVLHTDPYNVELYLEKDSLPEDHAKSKNIGKYGYVDIRPEARMDLTVQQLNEKFSTYKPTKEQKQASEGIYHPKRITDWLGLAPVVLPTAVAAGVTLPEWGPAAIATASNPAFWTELLKDTGTYIAADAASQELTGKEIGAHVNNAIGLEEDHPVGKLLSFGVANPTKKLIRKGINFTKKTLSHNPSYITRAVYPNGKTRIQLNSHTDEMPREIVLDPQGDNKFYVHIRTWNDVNKKIPANLPKEDINKLYEAFYTELPEGAEVLVPESGPGNYATRGTVAGLKRLARDKRFSPGKKGKVLYDDNGKVKTYKTTSFIKRLPVDEEYINRQLIPLAQQQGNWQGHTPITSNIAERTTFLSDRRIPFAGLFNGSGYFLNTYVGPELTLPTYLHEIRHGLDFSIKYNSSSGVNPIRRFLRTNPLYMFKKGTYRPILLTNDQIKLLNQAYPTKFKIPLEMGRLLTEKISVNAEMRYLFDNLYYKTFGKKPTVEQLNYFINTLPDDIFVETLFGSRSGYMRTYMSNIVKPLSKAEGTFTIHTPPSPIDGTTTLEVNKNVLGSESIKRMKQAITSVPSVAGIGYGIYNTQQTQ